MMLIEIAPQIKDNPSEYLIQAQLRDGTFLYTTETAACVKTTQAPSHGPFITTNESSPKTTDSPKCVRHY